MDERETRAMMEDVAAVMKSLVTNAVSPIVSRLDALEKRLADMPVPKDGKDADVDEIAALAAAALLPDIMEVRAMVEAIQAMPAMPDVPAMVADAVKAIPTPKDGASVTLDDVAPMIKAETERVGASILDAAKASVAELVAAIPPAVDGKDADVSEVVALVAEKIAPDMTKMRADLDALNPQIEAIGGEIGEEIAEHVGKVLASIPIPLTLDETKQIVAEAVAALPPVENGKDVDPVEVAALVTREAERILAGWDRPQDGKDGAQGEKGADGLNGADGKDGRNGLDAVKFFRDDKGHLIVVKSDGSTDDLGEYVGKDGAAGVDGKNGADGVGFDDMDLVETEHGVVLRFTRGDVAKDFRLPIVLDRGVFKEGTEYHKGDGVTWGGSFWIAQETSADKPDSGKGWRLAVKRGRDGKDGILKPPTKPGPVKVG